MSDIAGEAPPQPGNRSRKRDSLLLLGTIKAAGDYARETQQIRVRNLSSTGLMADSNVEYDLGSHVEVGLRGIGLVQGEIVWVRGGRMGITFSETVDPKRARMPVSAQSDDHLRKVVDIGRVRRPGLRID
ncbi:MAG: PilZ domain-containing protein [Pseudomonadota bacterium]